MRSEWAIVFATLLAPLLAIQATLLIQRVVQARRRREEIFKTLMATRATPISPEAVRALNMIDLEFYEGGTKARAVREAWREYFEHLSGDTSAPTWGERRQDLMVALLEKMAAATGYHFDRTLIRRHIYHPQGHVSIEEQIVQLREGVVAIVQGKRVIPVALIPTEVAWPPKADGSKAPVAPVDKSTK